MSGGPFSILGGVDYMDAMANPDLARRYAAQPQGILGGFNQFASENAAGLLGLGAGLLAGDNSAAAQGFAQGMQQDERTRLLQRKQQEEERQRVAAQQLAQKLGKPELAEFPELAGQLYVAMNKPKDPQLIGSAETGYTWATPGSPLPESFTKGSGPKQTDDIREYSFDMTQRKAMGQPVIPFGEWLSTSKKPGTVVNVGGEGSPLDKKLSEKEGEAWSAYKDGAAVSGGLQQDFAVIDELLKVAPQGPVAGRIAEAFPGVSTAGAAFQSVVKRVAPSLRTPGSGATSDIEYEGMLQALPRLSNKPEANRLIAETMKAKAELNVKRGEIITAYQNKQIDQATARAELDKINRVSILSPELKSALGQASGAQGAVSGSGVTSGGVKWSVK